MNRRGFLKLLGGAATTYFLPPIGGWQSDVIVNPGYVYEMHGFVFLMAEMERIDAAIVGPIKLYKSYADVRLDFGP